MSRGYCPFKKQIC